jgi:hypothetical protein
MKKLFTPKTLHHIDLKASPKVRASIRKDVVEEYFDAYEAKVKMPEVVLFEIEKDHFLIADGMHRVSAMLEFPEISKWAWTMDVRKGDYVECLRFALRANERHGLRRSNEDKRQAAVTALKEFPKVSNVQLAEIAVVSDGLIAELRKDLTNANIIPKSDKTTGKDGKERPVNLKNPRLDVKKPSKSEDSGDVDTEPARIVAGPLPVKDAVGITVPAKALAYWDRRQEVVDMMDNISNVKCDIEKANKLGDKMFVEVGNAVLADLSMCRQAISHALPYTVCPTCNGQLVEKCGLCRGRGVISKELYMTVPIEIRNMREKMMKKVQK